MHAPPVPDVLPPIGVDGDFVYPHFRKLMHARIELAVAHAPGTALLIQKLPQIELEGGQGIVEAVYLGHIEGEQPAFELIGAVVHAARVGVHKGLGDIESFPRGDFRFEARAKPRLDIHAVAARAVDVRAAVRPDDADIQSFPAVRVQGYPGHKARVLLITVVVIGGTEHVHVVAVRYSVAAVAVGSLIHRALIGIRGGQVAALRLRQRHGKGVRGGNVNFLPAFIDEIYPMGHGRGKVRLRRPYRFQRKFPAFIRI